MTTSTLLRPAGPRTAVRAGTALVLGGGLAEYAVTALHPHGAQPNDHAAAFAEYAASESWIAVHLGQFAAGLVLLVGVLVLLPALRSAGTPWPVARTGTALTVLAGGVFAVLQAVDGIALKHAVDSLAAAPAEQHAAWLHDAEIVRWTEWSLAAFSQLTLGLAVHALAVAVATSRALPRWTAVLAAVSAAGFLVNGVLVGSAGFSEDVLASLVGWLALASFGLTTTAAAWTTRR
jgi:hypothetical protein